MSLHNYLIQFRRAVEKLENYGYAESLESPLPSISNLVDEVIRYL